MKAVGYAIGRPRPGASRGGDCHVDNLDTGLRFDGPPPRFVEPDHCRIDNGLLRLTVSAVGSVPALTVAARRGRVIVGDLLSNTLSNTLPGSRATPEWIAMGTITIDSPSLAAALASVRVEEINPEIVTVRLVVPLIGHAFVTLRRGWRSITVQHGNTRPPLVDIDRRIRWTATPSPVGTAFPGRVEEMLPAVASFPRFVAAIDPVTADAGAFSVTAASVITARLTAGVGTYAVHDRPGHLHKQAGNASRPSIVVRADEDAA